jgi:hypothetical protein
MKRLPIILIIFIMTMPMATGFAQNPARAIDSLSLEFWPDYDKASVLVLLTGTLPADTHFPASVTLPLPEGAQLNAVARIDRSDGVMKDDIFSVPDPDGKMTFITPDPSFRVEYYLPYTVNNNQRSFDYTWLAEMPVNNFQVRVQRPTSADTLNTEPAAANVVSSGDGLAFYTLPERAVPAGQAFSLHVDYNMTNDQLSVASLPAANAGIQNSALPVTSKSGSDRNWALVAIIAGGFLILVALIWQIASRRSSSNVDKPADTGAEKQSRAKFCRNCGEPIDRGDRFCSGCGAEL